MDLSSNFTESGVARTAPPESSVGRTPPPESGAGRTPPPPLIGALLRAPYEAVRARMLTGLHERGFTDLIAAHVDVWRYPGPDNQRPLDLAKQTHMTKQALNYLLGQLEQLGYLTRETDGNDRRSKRVRLTPRGHAASRAIYESIQDLETEWEQELGARTFSQLRRALAQLYTVATPANASGTASASSMGPRSAASASGARSGPMTER